MTHCKYLVLGAGMSGLSTAYELSRDPNASVIVLEKESTVGGSSRTIGIDGCSYDLGSHRIHPNIEKSAFDLLEGMVGELLVKKTRRGKLRLKRAYIHYPINSVQFLRGVGPIEALLCIASLAKSRLIQRNSPPRDNYASYLSRKAGERAYRLFYEPYAHKVWGCDPVDISLTSVKKRVAMTEPLAFLKAVAGSLFGTPPAPVYYYIEGGIGRLPERMETKLAANQVRVIKNVTDLDLSSGGQAKRAGFRQGSTINSIEYDTLISTIAIDELVAKLSPEGHIGSESPRPRWRGLRLVYLHVEEEPGVRGETFYFPEKRYIFGRVSIPRRFSKRMQAGISSTCYVCEIPCTEGDAMWQKSERELYALCHTGLRDASLIGTNASQAKGLDFVIDIPKNYPLYTI